MKKRRNFWAADTLVLLLAVACLVLAVLLAIARPLYLLFALAPVLVALIFALASLGRIRKIIRRVLNNDITGGTSGLATFAMPVVALSGRVIVWYNEAFRHQVAAGRDNCLVPLESIVPGLDLAKAALPQGQDVALDDKRFTVFGSPLQADQNVFFVTFVNDTQLKHNAEEYRLTRPTVLYFVIDTYDEVLQEMRESDRAIIISNIDLAMEAFIGGTSGFLRRVSSSRYLAVVEERHMRQMVSARFDILDTVRKADEEGATVTMSIGAGRGGATLQECEEMARQALDMALGRGGDQAAVKSPDGYEFYGGVARSVEKRTKVKSRLIAAAIKDLMAQYDRVLVMGHKDSDMDCVGAAVGMLRFCRICQKPAAIVINTEKNLSQSLIDLLVENGYEDDMLTPEEALSLTGPRTLLVVVDTHIHYLLESEAVYRSCGATVVIDHHRRMVGHIDDAVIFYHEPYASSASELVTELLQYAAESKEDNPTPAESEALLAGIMLDTRTFSLHVGVRTFEAAAWLRRMGAQTAAVKKLFATTLNDYLYRSHLVSEAQVVEGCAVALSDKIPPECEVVAPQAANELLTIDGVDASFVGILQNGVVRISARSMGEVNVQLVMEKIGGGGHLTMAGAQLKNTGLDEAGRLLREAITAYMQERTRE